MMVFRATAVSCILLVGPAVAAVWDTNPVISLDGHNWRLAPDPQNVGVAEKWWEQPRPEAKSVKVPWTLQGDFPGYAGVAWYWRNVVIPANPHVGGRYLLRFWDVDYLADVWVNGTHVGTHEGAQARFTLDVTAAVEPETTNRIAVRVLSPSNQPIDGFVRNQTPHGGYTLLNIGGILDSVELVVAPQVRMDDLFVRADPKTGKIRIEAAVCNESKDAVRGVIEFTVGPATSGEPVSVVKLEQQPAPGASTIRAEVQVADPRLWQLNDPYLYRVTGRIAAAGSSSADQTSVRCGFREFRFENGYFRLNGRRVFWRSAHTGADAPSQIRPPDDPGMLRRDLLNLKAMGFNGIRFLSTMAQRYQLDMCDEIGLMVYEESHASWFLEESPQFAERMDRSYTGLVLRDRNHPSVVIWGLINETLDCPVFRHAVDSLPLIRRLDDSRIVLLGSGRWDAPGNFINGLEIWKSDAGLAPNLIFNPKSYGICFVPLWPAKQVALNRGNNGEYSAGRWTAPADGEYTVSARFQASGMYSLADVYVLNAGQPVLESFINVLGHADACEYRDTLSLSKGQAVDFVVGGGTSYNYGPWFQACGDNTTLAVTVTSADGTAYSLATDFSNAENPHGVWSYGWLAAGPTPLASTFKLYAKCESQNAKCIGSISNPGSDHWEDVLADQHYYPRVPHRALEINRLRTIAGNDHNLLLSEYGIGSGVNLPRLLRHYEQTGTDSCPIANEVKGRLAAFMADWQRLKLDDTFASPEDFFGKCIARMAGLRKMGINAVRSNPRIAGYGLTSCNDPLGYGEGLTTNFRELKPGTMDALYDSFYPVRWCTFAEPVSIYRGSKVHLEAVLSNEDSAPPGQYPGRLLVVGPDGRHVLDRALTVTIPGAESGQEPPLAMPVFAEDVSVDGPTGQYRFLVTFEKGVAASGGEAVFYVTDPAEMPPVDADVAMWGDDPQLAQWLKGHGVQVRPYQPGPSNAREIVLVSYAPRAGGSAAAWRDLAARIAQGSTAIFLTLDVFKQGDNPLGWMPLAKKGGTGMVSEYTFPQVYPMDEWNKKHALFDGLPCGGLMDHTFYREIIPDYRHWGQDTPSEAVAGSFRTSCPGHHCDLMLSVYNFGAGRFILNTLRVRPELGLDPIAERLLRNMLRHAAPDVGKPPVELPPGFEARMKEIGYE